MRIFYLYLKILLNILPSATSWCSLDEVSRLSFSLSPISLPLCLSHSLISFIFFYIHLLFNWSEYLSLQNINRISKVDDF